MSEEVVVRRSVPWVLTGKSAGKTKKVLNSILFKDGMAILPEEAELSIGRVLRQDYAAFPESEAIAEGMVYGVQEVAAPVPARAEQVHVNGKELTPEEEQRLADEKAQKALDEEEHQRMQAETNKHDGKHSKKRG